jgi:nucleobase transporter 1/2
MLILFVALSQYLKHVNIHHVPVLERFSLLMCIALVWVYAHILTASGAYKHTALVTQINCRTDRANLISSSQWFGDFPMPH